VAIRLARDARHGLDAALLSADGERVTAASSGRYKQSGFERKFGRSNLELYLKF
jgi:hypothetical protein